MASANRSNICWSSSVKASICQIERSSSPDTFSIEDPAPGTHNSERVFLGGIGEGT